MAQEQKTIQQFQNELERLQKENSQLKRFWLESNAIQISDGVEWDSSGILDAIFENAQPVIYMLDAEGKFLVSEGKGLEALGLTPGQVVGLSAYDIYRDNPAIISGIQAALTGKYVREKIFVDGIVFDAFFSPYRDQNGKTIGVLGMAVDITDREQALLELRQMTQIVEQATDSIIYTDTNFEIKYINQAAVEMYGWQLKELFGKRPDVFNAEPLKDEFQQKIYDTVSSGEIFVGQAINIRKDGSTFDCEMRVSSITDSEGTLIGYMSLTRDVTDRNLAEASLKRKLDETSILHEISEIGATLLDENSLIKTVTDLVNETFYTDHVGVLLFDESGEVLYPHPTFIGIKPEDYSVRIALGEGVSGKVAQTGEPMIVADVSQFEGYIPTEKDLSSEICAPLTVSGKVIGVINVESKELNAFTDEDMHFLTTIASQLATAIERTRLYRDLVQSNQELHAAYNRTLEGWARALELRDHETQGHTERVTRLAVSLARAVGIQEPELTHIRRGALLHDIGKIGIPDSILFKPGPLNESEIAVMQRHTIYGRDLLARIPFLMLALDIPYLHHEKWDGSGYPLGLSGEQIPLPARIFAIVDVWDALISTRPYRPAWSKQDALGYIQKHTGSHFDPELVPIFEQVLFDEGLL